MTKPVNTHSFNGVSYKIRVDVPIDGWCDKPKKPQKSEYLAIWLPNGLPFGDERGAKNGLITLIHECLHAEHWKSREKTVDRVSTEIGSLLWRLGYRRKKVNDT